MRVGHSACEASDWVSETSVNCRVGGGVLGSRRVTVTAGDRPGSLTEALSFDVPSLSVLTRGNRATTGSASVTVHGSNFAHARYTQAMRVGHSACEASDWVSETSVYCRIGAGVFGSLRVTLTAGDFVGSLTNALSFDVPPLSVLTRENRAATGSARVIVQGSSFGSVSYTHLTLPTN